MEDKRQIKKYLIRIVLLLILFLIIVLFMNIFSYFDVLNVCYINIGHDTMRGNRATIIKAIKLLRSKDKNAYKTLCHYVDIINEDECWPSDPSFEKELWQNFHPSGCYIKGSKVIYLIPEKNEGKLIIEKRSELIKKYAQKSKEFWDNFEKNN